MLHRVCAEYGVQFDMVFNPKECCCYNEGGLEEEIPFFLFSESSFGCCKVKSLGHILSDLCDDDDGDDDDVKPQGCKLCLEANMLTCKFNMCTDVVKVSLF